MSDASYNPLERWPPVRDQLFGMIRLLIGRPLPDVLLAGKGLLSGGERLLVLKWLRPLERMVRSFVMMAACALPETGRGPPPWPFRDDFGVRRGPRGPAQEPRRRTGFRVLMGRPSQRHDGRSDPETNEHYSAWVLVERLDAVLGVIDNPAPHIARLARLIGAKPEIGRLGLAEPRTRPKPQRRGISDLAYPYLVAETEELAASSRRRIRADTRGHA